MLKILICHRERGLAAMALLEDNFKQFIRGNPELPDDPLYMECKDLVIQWRKTQVKLENGDGKQGSRLKPSQASRPNDLASKIQNLPNGGIALNILHSTAYNFGNWASNTATLKGKWIATSVLHAIADHHQQYDQLLAEDLVWEMYRDLLGAVCTMIGDEGWKPWHGKTTKPTGETLLGPPKLAGVSEVHHLVALSDVGKIDDKTRTGINKLLSLVDSHASLGLPGQRKVIAPVLRSLKPMVDVSRQVTSYLYTDLT